MIPILALLSYPSVAQDTPPPAVPSVVSSTAWLRAGVTFAMVPHGYELTSEAEDIPDGYSFSNPLATGGFEFHALGWAPDPEMDMIGGELWFKGFSNLVRASTEQMLEEDRFNAFSTNIYFGPRVRGELGDGLWWHAGLGYHRFTTLLFRYAAITDETPALLRRGVGGARLNAGVTGAFGDLWVDGGIAETFFVLQPIDFQIYSAAEYALSDELAARLSLDLDFRTIRFLIGEDEVEANVRDNETTISFGLSYLLR